MNIRRNIDAEANGIRTSGRAEVPQRAAGKQAISGELLFERKNRGGKKQALKVGRCLKSKNAGVNSEINNTQAATQMPCVRLTYKHSQGTVSLKVE